MALNAQETIIGPAFVSVNGTELGLTTDDGVTLSTEFANVELEAAQSLVTPRIHRQRVTARLAATFYQLTLAAWRLLEDLKDAPSAGNLVGSWNSKPTDFELVLTMPGANGSTRVLVAVGNLVTPGEKVFSNGSYTGAPVEWQLIGDPTTNTYWTISETASSAAAPAPSSYAKIVSGTPTTITDGATNVEATAKLQIVFNVGVRPDQLTAGKFILKSNSGNDAVACSIAYGETAGNKDYGKIVLTPAASLTAATTYDLIVPPGLLSFDGVASTGLAAMQFTTAT